MMAAIDRDCFPGYVIAPVRLQKQNKIAQLLDLPETLHGHPVGLGCPKPSFRASGSTSATRIRSGNGPGATAFTRMPYCAHSTASDLVMASMAAFDIADGTT